MGAGSELENDPQGRVDSSEFIEAEASDLLAEPGGIHCSDLLDQNPSRGPLERPELAEAHGTT